MKKMTRVIIAVFMVPAFLTLAHAGTSRTLDWEDLAPPVDDLAKLFDHLTDIQLSDLHELHRLKEWAQMKDEKAAVDDGINTQIVELEEKLRLQKLDVRDLTQKLDAAMSEYERRSKQPVRSLDGTDIRLAGYVLPLEFNGVAVSEFFLVPYVGACIHTPPPSANQIVLVTLNQSYRPEGLYEAVWITGKLKIVESEHQLSYRDGAGAITTTYHMDDVRITPYE